MARAIKKSLAKDPFIRALGFKCFPKLPRSFMVLGGSTPHEVFVYGDKLKCDCTAASYGTFCAHVAAVQYIKQQEQQGKDLKELFTLDRTSSERKNPVLLPRPQKMAYAGLFSGWFMIETQYGPSVGIKCLITHIASGKSWEKLDQITEGATFLNPKWFYNAKKREASHLVQLVSVLSGIDPQTLALPPDKGGITTEQVKALLNEGVGSGLTFTASIETKNDIDRNAIEKDSFIGPDSSFAPLAAAMTAKVEVGTSKDGQAFIAKPKPQYQEDQTQYNAGPPPDESQANSELDESAIPF